MPLEMEKLHIIAIVDKTGNDAKESRKISLASLRNLPTTVQRKVAWWVRCDLEKKPLRVSRNFTHLKIHVNFIRKYTFTCLVTVFVCTERMTGLEQLHTYVLHQLCTKPRKGCMKNDKEQMKGWYVGVGHKQYRENKLIYAW